MRGLSFVEFIALLFTGVAGLASAVQAYVSWDTRGEVSRAIVFAQRIDACARVVAAIEPFVAKARSEGRELVATGSADGRYSLPQYYYRQSSGNAAFDMRHGPRVQSWREAAAAFLIVTPDGGQDQIAFFDKAITMEIPAGKFMSQAEMISWLGELEGAANGITTKCRQML